MAKKDMQMNDTETEDETLDDSAESRVYELGFHLDPELPSEEVKKTYHTVHEIIAKNGTVVAEGEPQMIPLAYTISRQDTAGRRDFDSAHFCWIVYEASTSSHSEILSVANADKRIIRFIDLITTKDAARHAVEIREFSIKTSERTKEPEPEEVANVELDAALEHVVV